MVLRMAARYSILLLVITISIGIRSYSQTTQLSFTSISLNDPDLNAPGRGVEQWHDQNVVNVPTEGINTQRLDVYYRFVWTKIEGPTLGSYKWGFFDSLVNNAIINKQKFSFGIMSLYPGGTTDQGLVSFDGGLASYPLYLHSLMQSESVKDWKTGSVWTPNYNSASYLDRLLALYQAINAHLNSTSFNGVLYRNVIGYIDLRGYGAWGEWHSGYTPNNLVSDYPTGTFPTVATLKKIVDAHTQGFPDFPLVAMIAAFDAYWLQNTMNPPEIAYYILTQRNNWGLIGWRRDQWGATDGYISSYLENNTRSFGGLVFKDSIMPRWKTGVITGEPPGWNPNSYSALETQVRLYHAASFGNGNYGTNPTSTIKSRVRASSKACGYRLIIEGGTLTKACKNISITLNWKNIGLTPTYENWDVVFELKNSGNTVVWTGLSQFKPKMFLPASTSAPATDNFSLPANLAAGTYNLNVLVKDPNGYRDPLPLAITGRNSDGSYPLSQITIPAGPAVSVTNYCGNSVLTATGSTGTLLWSTGETTTSITVATPGTYSVTQTTNGCSNAPTSVTAAPLNSTVVAPAVSVTNNCGSSVLTASGFTGALLWSTGATTNSISVTAPGTYSVTQTVSGCTSSPGSGIAAPATAPVLSSNLSASATSGVVFSYTPTSSTGGTTFAWSRAAVAGISNSAATGSGNISETLVNTTASPVVVTYVYTLTANGCVNTQNILVTVGIDVSIGAPAITTQPSSQSKCEGLDATFNSFASGSPAPTVQWQETTNGNSWHNLAGATSGTLTIAATVTNNNNQYRAVWTNSAGSVTSNAATLTVNPNPSAPSVTVADNCGASTLTAIGAPTATFSWNTGATTSFITVTTSATYTVTQTVNGCTSFTGSGTSNYRAIPDLTSNLAATVASGTAFTYVPTSAVSGTIFAWSRAAVAGITNGTADGTGSISETLINTTASPVIVTYVYTLTANGCTYTQNVSVTVGADGSIVFPLVTTQPTAQTKCADDNVIFSSDASGSPAPTVQWQESTNGTTWNNINGATSATLSFTTTTADNNKQYRSVWTNSAGSVNSNAVVLTVNAVPSAPSVSVTNNCGGSVLTASGAPTATFLWSTGATTASITVATSASYSVTQTVNGCTSTSGNAVSNYMPIPDLSSNLAVTATSGTAFTYTPTSAISGTTFAWDRAAVVGVSNSPSNGTGSINETLINTTASAVNVIYAYTLTANSCTNTQNVVVTVNANPIAPTLTTQPLSQTRCSGLTASLSSAANGSPAPTVQWQESTNGTTWNNINGATSGTLTFTTSPADDNKQYHAVWTNIAGSIISDAAVLTVNPTPSAPSVSVVDNCGNSLLTAAGVSGATFSWSNGSTTSDITVATAGTYTVTQALNGCASLAGSGVAAPKPTPVLSSNLSATAISGSAFTYTPTSGTPGTSFTWGRAAVTGISNVAANGTGSINEILVNTTASPISVTYVYTLTANGCSNTQNVVVGVSPSSIVNCVINGSIASTFNSTSIPAGRFIWFSSAVDRGNLNGITGTVTFNITNAKITFTANSQVFTLNVPDSRIRYDAALTSATTQFVDNVWETAVPRSYSGYVFMGGLNYQVPANLPGNISNVTWTATISIDKAGIRPTWKWAAAVYTSLAAHPGLNIKPKNGSTQNPYPNNDDAGTPENYKSFVVAGAKGNGGTNYTGNYSNTSSATCSTGVGQRLAEPLANEHLIVKDVNELPLPGEKLNAIAIPNPSTSSFNLMIKGNRKSLLSIKVIDISGRVVERHDKVVPNTAIKIGQRLAAGSYFVEVRQDGLKKIISVIKVN